MTDVTRSKPDEGKPVQITLPATTAQIVVDALDLYSRVGLGQFDEITSLARFGLLKNAKGESPSDDDIEEAEVHLKQAKRTLFGFEPSASHGIFSPKLNSRFKDAWTVLKAVRHRLAWDRNPEGGIQVSYDEPMRDETAMGVTVTSAGAADFLEELPADMLVTRFGSGWAVVKLHPTDRALQVVAESHSPQTAIQMAKNSLSGPKRDTF